MNTITVILFLVIVFLVAFGTVFFVKPLRNIVMQGSANGRDGLYEDPEFLRQLRRLNAIRWATIAAQIILLGIALILVSQPLTIWWIALVILFVISQVIRGRMEAARLKLLTQGLKKD